MGANYYHVKSIMLKNKIQAPYDIQILDVDYHEKYLVILPKSNKQKLEFHELDLILSPSYGNDIKSPYFTLKFQTDIQDYFFNKNTALDHLSYKNFLIVQTFDALIIYRESEQKIMKKVFSLNFTTSSPKETRFKFIFDNPNKIEKGIYDLIGAFYILQKNTLSVYYIKNLESKQQTIISDMFKIILSHYENNELVCIKSENLNTTEICTYSQKFIVAKYIVTSNDTKKATKLDCFKLLTRSIDTNNFVYNHKNKYVYGNMKHKDMIFAALKNKYESKFFYKIVLYEKEHFLSCYWALINKSLFVKINIETKQIKLFKILTNQIDVIIVQKTNFELLDNLENICLIRFVLLSEMKFLTIIENHDSYTIVEFVIENENITIMDPIFSIKKIQLSDNKITQYELIQINKADLIYVLIFSDNTNRIRTFVLQQKTNNIYMKSEISFKENILEFYRSKKYPHNIVVLTSDNKLTFLDVELNFLADYDLRLLGLSLNSDFNNFQMKYLYDDFFIVS